MLQPLCNWWSSETWITLPAGGPQRPQGAVEIDPIEAQDDIGFSEMRRQLVLGERLRRIEMHGMIGRERGTHFRRGADISADRLGQCNAMLPRRYVARHAASENDRMLCRL